MTRNTNTPGPLSLDTNVDEERVRRALGLTGSSPQHQQVRPDQARQRHKFVADGAVPVVMLNRSDAETSGLRERLAHAEDLLAAEKQAHAATRRALTELQAAHQSLQTRLQHSEMAAADALKAERNARQEAEMELAARPAPTVSRPKRAATPEHAPEEALDRSAPLAEPPAKTPGRRGRPRRVEASVKEAQPVRWWTPSYRAKNGKS